MQMVGIPSSDHLAYDTTACIYVDCHDAAREAIGAIENTPHLNLDMHLLAEWLHQGINLIHSMQNLRDGRPKSVEVYRASTRQWHSGSPLSARA